MDEIRRQALVLLIEAEPDVLANLAATLDRAGYVCHCCDTGEAAIRFAQSRTPDLILSEVNLSGVRGLEICQRIKGDPMMAHVPVMFLSGNQIPDIIRRRDALGGTYYLRKPCDPEVLLELVDKAVWRPRFVDAAEAVHCEAAVLS